MKEVKTEELLERMKGVIAGFAAGKTVAEMRGLSPDEVEAIYSLGYTYYQVGKLDEAENAFRFACLLDHRDGKYWLALGAVLQTKRQYAEAVKVYANVLVTDVKEPRAYYRIAECKLAQGNRAEALEALELLEQMADVKTSVGREYVAKAKQMRARLKG